MSESFLLDSGSSQLSGQLSPSPCASRRWGRMGSVLGIIISMAVQDLMSDKSVIKECAGKALKYLRGPSEGGGEQTLSDEYSGNIYDAEVTRSGDDQGDI